MPPQITSGNMRFFKYNFRKKTLELLERIKLLLAGEYRDSLPLTLRQLFYIVISQPNAPLQNTYNDYQRLCRDLRNARYAGVIPFETIEDRTRYTSNLPFNLDDAISHYYPEAWAGQPRYFEVFVEKEALRSFFNRILRQHYVMLNVGRGYDSLSDVMEIAQRFHEQNNKERCLFTFTDFDPSGDDIARDIDFRIGKCLIMLGEEPSYFSEEEKRADIPNFTTMKIALTEEQVKKHNLPPMFAKEKDPRASSFVDKYGSEAVVELDSLPPRILADIISNLCNRHLNLDEEKKIQRKETRIKKQALEALEFLR
jgi:hypothetical protein